MTQDLTKMSSEILLNKYSEIRFRAGQSVTFCDYDEANALHAELLRRLEQRDEYYQAWQTCAEYNKSIFNELFELRGKVYGANNANP